MICLYSLDGVMYVVTGPTGDMMPQGFTIYVREDGRRDDGVIARWSPGDNVRRVLALTPAIPANMIH